MKAIILAGGKSSRLKSFTENMPKCLLKVNNKPILEYQLEALIENGITDLVIVIGYKGFMIKEFIDSKFKFLNVTYIENDDYATTGTSYGWWLARNQIKNEESIIHLNSDLVFFPELLKRLLDYKGENVVCIDKHIQLNDSMEQVMLYGDRIIFMDKRNIKGAEGKAVGIAKFSNIAINFMINEVEKFMDNGDKNQHFYGMIRIALNYHTFYGLDIDKSFFREVNTIEDYNIAKRDTETNTTKPILIMLYGLPATGKTTISRKIRDYFDHQINTKLISTFRIREEMGLEDLYSKNQREQVYQSLFILLEKKLKMNVDKCIILDGNFNKRDRRKMVYDIVKKYNADLYVLKCIVDNQTIIKKRMNQRKKQIGILEHKASNIDLYNMIDQETDPIEADEEKPLIITINTQTNKIKVNKNINELPQPNQLIIGGILNAIN